ncbi:hypothetical protein [Paraburkholderia sp. SIMBA_030]|uniref:hypothetical protein n=1 Tax=Paraburkholderia sp. SIMBA_030 TaxID=3085773 RepID=UPI00397BAB96
MSAGAEGGTLVAPRVLREGRPAFFGASGESAAVRLLACQAPASRRGRRNSR